MKSIVGRNVQTQKIIQLWESTLKGMPTVVLLSGDAGSGKTYLLQSITGSFKAKYKEAVMVGSSCSTMATVQQTSYFPFLQLLENLSKKEKGWKTFREAMTNLAPDWVKLLPGGDVLVATIKTIKWISEETKESAVDANKLMSQYTNTLFRFSEQHPLLIWIEDIHWADLATLDMISFVAERIQKHQIMIILTMRTTDVATKHDGQSHPAKKMISKLQRQQKVVQLNVPNFSKGETQEYLNLSKHNFSNAFIDKIYDQSGGNPLYLRELISYLHQTGTVIRREGNFEIQDDKFDKIPLNIQSIVEERLDLLPEDLKKILTYASVQGIVFEGKILSQLLEESHLRIIEKISILAQEYNMLLETEELDYFQFNHAVTRLVIYNKLGKNLKQILHIQTANILESISSNKSLYLLAFHFEHGHNYEKAIHYYTKNGQDSLDNLAIQDAIQSSEIALRLTGKISNSQEAELARIKAFLLLAECYFAQANYQKVIAICEDGENICSNLNICQSLGDFLYWKSKAYFELDYQPKSLEITKMAISQLSKCTEGKKVLGHHLVRLGLFRHLIDKAEIETSLNYALELASEHKWTDLWVDTMINKIVFMDHSGKPKEVYELSKELLEFSTKNKLLESEMLSHKYLAQANRQLKNNEESFYHLVQATEIAGKAGFTQRRHWALGRLAVAWWEIKENTQKGLETIRESLNIAAENNFPVNRDVALSWFILTFNLGLWEEAAKAQERFKNHDPEYPRDLGIYYLEGAHVESALRNYKKAETEYERALLVMRKVSADERDFRRAQTFYGISLAQSGNILGGYKQLNEAKDFWEGKKDTVRYARCLRGLALCAINEYPQEAESLLRQASILSIGTYTIDAWPEHNAIQLDLTQTLVKNNKIKDALQIGLEEYRKLKQWSHFLLGDAAFLLAQIYTFENNVELAKRYLIEAQLEWKRLQITATKQGNFI